MKQGEGLFINASGLHEAKPYQIEQATVYCVNVDPKLMGHEGSIFFSKYVEPYITRNRIPYVKLTGELAQKVATIAELMRAQAAF